MGSFPFILRATEGNIWKTGFLHHRPEGIPLATGSAKPSVSSCTKRQVLGRI